MIFNIFSFNRAKFLAHCVASIQQCAPGAKIKIFDDDSSDPETLRILESLSGTHEVIQASSLTPNPDDHGGLYANMQHAVQAMPDNALYCMLQDDMQLVRAISEAEIAQWTELLIANPTIGFLQPCFLKGRNQSRYESISEYQAQSNTYTRVDSKYRIGTYYSDIFMSIGGRLRDWTFQRNEKASDDLARAQFERLHGNPPNK